MLEYWQRGPVENIPALLQPVAHALLQAREELTGIIKGFPESLLWEKPAGMASVGFHLQHLSGVIDRLFTYARNEQLSEAQWQMLKEEALPFNPNLSIDILLTRFNAQVDKALLQLQQTKESELNADRFIGRKKIPTTTIGLLFHAAEHTMRHIGQILTTTRILISVRNIESFNQ
ncbi:MAG: DinB family protein [Bacteroidetes bacterium]|nr:DinB family protein [Bacteroidota bacterium]